MWEVVAARELAEQDASTVPHFKVLFCFVLFCQVFETQATWLRNNKETSPVLVRLWLEKVDAQCSNGDKN